MVRLDYNDRTMNAKVAALFVMRRGVSTFWQEGVR
jgi:hypothetical protein